MEPDDILKLLSSNASFQGVPDSALSALIRAGSVVELEDGTDLMVQGKTGQSIWVLLDGQLEVKVDSDVVNRISNSGELLGEISAVSMTPATATVSASGPVVALEVPPRGLHAAMEDSAELAKSMILSMTKYLGRR